MKKLKAILLPIGIIVIFAICILIGKMFIGTEIAHYKQYLYPCQGQIIGTTNIQFYFLDEEKLSELADINNIKDIFILTDSGEEKKAEKWSVSEKLLYYSEKYVHRVLSISVPSEEEFVIKELTIVYPDTKETFVAGSLKVIPWNIITADNMEIESSCKFLELPVDWTDPDFKPQGAAEPFSQETLEPHRSNFIHMDGKFYSVPDSVTITEVDFGITGMGIDPNTIRIIQGDTVEPFGDHYAFAVKPENEIYLQNDLLEKLPEQTFSVTVDKQEFSIYASIRLTEAYKTELNCLYISPIYYCIDNITEEEIVYGNTMNYDVLLPMLQYEEEVQKIVEENGI